MTTPAIQKLCEVWGWPWPENAMVTAVRATFPELLKMPPPVDIGFLAARRSIVRVREVSMKLDGRILRTPGGGYQVEVNAAHSKERRRFTCAHEIGHTFFFDLGGESATLKNRALVEDGDLKTFGSDNQEEVLCNLAAAEILMPHPCFSSSACSLGPSANTVLKLSQSFCTSLWSTARRLAQISPLRLMVVLWEYELPTNRYFSKWIVTARRSRWGQRLSVDEGMPIFTSFRSRVPFRGRKWVSLGGPVDDYFVDALPLSSPSVERILTLFILDPLAESILGPERSTAPDPDQLALF